MQKKCIFFCLHAVMPSVVFAPPMGKVGRRGLQHGLKRRHFLRPKGGNGHPLPLTLHAERHSFAFCFRAETVGFSCENCWFPVRNQMVFRAECDGFPCRMRCFFAQSVYLSLAERVIKRHSRSTESAMPITSFWNI